MPGKIYLLGDDGNLEPLAEQPYASEDLLRGFLGAYPDLLAGSQLSGAGGSPRRGHPPVHSRYPGGASMVERWSRYVCFCQTKAGSSSTGFLS